jgi:hypothetical protein
LTLGKLIAQGGLEVSDLADDFTTYLLITLWVMTSLTYARDFSTGLAAAIEAAVTVFVSVIAIKISLAFAGMGTRILWSILGGFVPFGIPDWIRQPVNALIETGAALGLLVLFLGYTWTKAREHFGRWATVRTDGAEKPPICG